MHLGVVRLAASVLDLCRVSASENSGAVSEVAAVPRLDGDRLVAAVRTAQGRLQLVVWRVQQPSGTITRLADSGTQAGDATFIDIAKGGSYVTAFRTASGDLKLICWDVAANGTVTRRGDSGEQAGAATHIRIVSVSPDLFVTALRTAEGRLRLIPWQVNASGSITRLGDGATTAERVSEIDLVVHSVSGGGGRLVSVARTAEASDAIKLISWNVTATGGISRLRDSGSQAGAGTLVRIVRDAHANVVTAARVGFSILLVAWRVGSDGSLNRAGESLGYPFAGSNEALLAQPDGVLCATRTATGQANLAAYSTDAAGTITHRSDTAEQADIGTLVDLVGVSGTADSTGRRISTIALVRTSSGALRLTSWGPACVRLHLKVLSDPNIPIATMLASMQEIYGTVGIRVQHLSTERLSLSALADLDIGACSTVPTSAEHQQLFTHRNGVAAGDVVVYFVRSITPPLNGCAASPEERPAAVVARIASEFTLAHEVGHVLGLGHIDDNNRLMTKNSTDSITNPPPDLVGSEASQMQRSSLTNVCAGS